MLLTTNIDRKLEFYSAKTSLLLSSIGTGLLI
jgi:hypothetical protein